MKEGKEIKKKNERKKQQREKTLKNNRKNTYQIVMLFVFHTSTCLYLNKININLEK